MKKILKKIIVCIITLEAKLVLLRFKPRIIAVTGSVGKTSTKNSIFAALSNSIHIRKNQKSFNSEIGVPLTILGLDNGYLSLFKWSKNIFGGLLVLFKKKYPKWLVLEFGVDRPGDMERLTKWIKVDIAVFTSFPDVPVHVEYFSSPKEIIEEKKKLLKVIKPEGIVILNADDPEVLQIKDCAKRKIMTFGIENSADIKVSNAEILYKDDCKPIGINFKIDYQNNSIPIRVKGVLGNQHIYPVLASMACGVSLGITTIEMSSSLENYNPAPGRMRILEGINGSTIIDDSYNASPIAVHAGINVLASVNNNGCKIAVLGDMSEIGRYTASEHKIVGKLVADLKIDYLFTLGKRAEFIAEEALISGMDNEHVFIFSDFNELTKELNNYIKDCSIVLVKGSQSMRMEKIIKQLLLEPEKASELLVRQDKFWTSYL